MKIINLKSENFKRIVAIDITPTGNMVEIAGRNGQGKSSILDAIWCALAGLSNAPKQPIRAGQLESNIVLTLGTDKPEIIVTRNFKPKADGSEITSKITVESVDGARFPSPQAVLDKLLGALTFDPLQFERMDAREQYNTLRAFVPGIDFDAIDDANRGDYDRRSAANRKAKEARAAAAAIKVDPNLPAEAVSADALIAKLDEAGKHNADIEMRKANREKLRDQAARMAEQAKTMIDNAVRLRAEADALCVSAGKIDDERSALVAKLDAAPLLPEPIDTAAIRAEIAGCNAVTEGIRQRNERERLLKVAEAAEQEAQEYTLNMDKREVEKREAIAAAKLPVAGIEFGNNALLYKGVPFEQASDAERLTVSIGIAMAMNPKLRVIRVRDGSLLDDSSMAVLARMADEHDYQVWIEVVDSTGKVGITIEDGKVLTSADK